jgi:hypothetical protein
MIAERPSLERRLLESLDAGRIPVLLGDCGTGRTSLLLRLEQALGEARSQYLDLAAAASTPERCLRAVAAVSRLRPAADPPPPGSPLAAFDTLLQFFDGASSGAPMPVTFLVDDFLDVRTFENFPGLRHVQRDFVARLAASPTRFVLASRFTARVHRLLRDAPARFEVVHVPPLDADEVRRLAERFDGAHRPNAPDVASAVAALADGRAAYVHLLLGAVAAGEPALDPVAAMASLLAPDGRLTARCREGYDHRLSRARGFGALKAILGVLADAEPLNLTEIAHQLQRTPGSTKDYLSWLEDVDLIRMLGKRYGFADPILRLYVRLYGRPVPPRDDDIVREVGQYARACLPQRAPALAVPAGGGPPTGDRSGIIEID